MNAMASRPIVWREYFSHLECLMIRRSAAVMASFVSTKLTMWRAAPTALMWTAFYSWLRYWAPSMVSPKAGIDLRSVVQDEEEEELLVTAPVADGARQTSVLGLIMRWDSDTVALKG